MRKQYKNADEWSSDVWSDDSMTMSKYRNDLHNSFVRAVRESSVIQHSPHTVKPQVKKLWDDDEQLRKKTYDKYIQSYDELPQHQKEKIQKISWDQFNKPYDDLLKRHEEWTKTHSAQWGPDDTTYFKMVDSLEDAYVNARLQKDRENKYKKWLQEQENKSGEDNKNIRCPSGYEYVNSHYSDGHYVKGFCRKKAR